jgi:phosphonoacetaldehyde hydrolase
VRACCAINWPLRASTLPGISEGVSAGMWTVGLALSGSPAGLTLAQYKAATTQQLTTIRSKVTPEFEDAGANYVIDSVADLVPVLKDIERRLGAGERP